MARRYRYLDEAKYPPFNPNVPVTTDISDQEKRNRGAWHIYNAQRQNLDRSILISAFNDAKARGFSDDQAYEYVRDVAASKGWSRIEQNMFQPIVYNKPLDINNPKDRAIMAQRETIAEDLQHKRQEKPKRIAAGVSAVGSALTYAPHPVARVLGVGMQIPDMYYDIKDIKGISDANGIGETVLDFPKAIAQVTNTPIDDYIQPVGMLNDALYAITGNSLLDRANTSIQKIRKSIKRTKGK